MSTSEGCGEEGLTVKEVDQRNKYHAGCEKDEVGFPLESINNNRGYHRDGKVPEPVATNANSGSLSAGAQGQQLGHVNPRDAGDARLVSEADQFLGVGTHVAP